MGIRGPKSWFGEEILFLNERQAFPYKVVTRTPVKLLRILKISMIRRLDPDYLQRLIINSKDRWDHNKKRESSIDNARQRIG